MKKKLYAPVKRYSSDEDVGQDVGAVKHSRDAKPEKRAQLEFSKLANVIFKNIIVVEGIRPTIHDYSIAVIIHACG